MHILRVDEINDFVGTGICDPLFGKIKDTNVVIKTYNNIESNRVLANELICYKIAKILDLPIPEAGLCLINGETLIPNELNFDEQHHGIGFYSTRISKATRGVITPNIIKNFITNKEDIIKVILFDHLIRNEDRHRSNLLLELSGKGRIVIIDHSHVFKLGPLWSCYQLDHLMEEEDYKNNGVLQMNKDVYQVLFQSINIEERELVTHAISFEEKLSGNIINDIVYDLPIEWGINDKDKEKLIEYIKYRLYNLRNMCSMIAMHSY